MHSRLSSFDMNVYPNLSWYVWTFYLLMIALLKIPVGSHKALVWNPFSSLIYNL